MKIIYITGGVGSGKSEVMRVLQEDFNAEIMKADDIAHDLMEPGTECLKKLTEKYGTGFLDENGAIDRPAFARLIFSDEAILNGVNEIVHPMVWYEIIDRIHKSDKKLAVVEAAIPDKYGIVPFDETWYVYTSEENRIKRLMASRGYSEEKCRDIIKNQVSEDYYRGLANRVIDNNGTVEDICRQLKTIICDLENESAEEQSVVESEASKSCE